MEALTFVRNGTEKLTVGYRYENVEYSNLFDKDLDFLEILLKDIKSGEHKDCTVEFVDGSVILGINYKVHTQNKLVKLKLDSVEAQKASKLDELTERVNKFEKDYSLMSMMFAEVNKHNNGNSGAQRFKMMDIKEILEVTIGQYASDTKKFILKGSLKKLMSEIGLTVKDPPHDPLSYIFTYLSYKYGFHMTKIKKFHYDVMECSEGDYSIRELSGKVIFKVDPTHYHEYVFDSTYEDNQVNIILKNNELDKYVGVIYTVHQRD